MGSNTVIDGLVFHLVFLFCHFFSPKACVRCKEKSGLARSRNESNVGQDSAEARGNGARKQVRRPDPGWAWARLAVAFHSLFINGLCCLKSIHPLFMPTSQGNGATTGKNPPHPPQGLNRILDNSMGAYTDRFHRLKTMSHWPRTPS